MTYSQLLSNYFGWKKIEILETREDPKVYGVVAVRYKINDKDYDGHPDENGLNCVLVECGEVTDEFMVEKDLKELKVGEPRFW